MLMVAIWRCVNAALVVVIKSNLPTEIDKLGCAAKQHCEVKVERDKTCKDFTIKLC